MPSSPLRLTSTNVPRAEDAESARYWCVVSIVEAGGGRWKVTENARGGGWGLSKQAIVRWSKLRTKKREKNERVQ